MMTNDDGIYTTERALVAAFVEWDRRYREEPERFMTEVEHLLRNTPASYGESAAAYLLALMSGTV
jgi:hypothetical protein